MEDEEDFEQEFNTLSDADFNDGVYILASRRHFLSKQLEYRVAYVNNVDEIYGEKSKEKIKEKFDECFSYKDEDEAIRYAFKIFDELKENGIDPEHGVGVIYKWEDLTFKKLIGG